MAEFEVQKEVSDPKELGRWRLCFQYGIYHYEDKGPEAGFRFIWRDSDNNMRPQRGQARIPDAARLLRLLSLAAEGGWLK